MDVKQLSTALHIHCFKDMIFKEGYAVIALRNCRHLSIHKICTGSAVRIGSSTFAVCGSLRANVRVSVYVVRDLIAIEPVLTFDTRITACR